MTTISTPEDLLNALPILLTFHPENSFISIAIKDGQLDSIFRSNLPECEDPDFLAAMGAQISKVDGEEIVILIYLPDGAGEKFSDSYWSLFREEGARHLPLRDFLVISDGEWRSLLCSSHSTCPSLGQPIPDITASQFAAEHVLNGQLMPVRKHRDLRSAFAHRFGNWDAQLPGLIANQFALLAQLAPTQRSRNGAIALLRMITEFTISRAVNNLEVVAGALVALDDIQVRDFAIGAHGDENLNLHRELWCALLQIAPDGYCAPVATLFALLAYESGDGVSAKYALERALTDDPHYSLAHLLQKTFAAGWPPEAFTTMRQELHPKLEEQLLG